MHIITVKLLISDVLKPVVSNGIILQDRREHFRHKLLEYMLEAKPLTYSTLRGLINIAVM
jgi:hypothetical protein